MAKRTKRSGGKKLRTIEAQAKRVPLLIQDLYRTELRATAAERELAGLKQQIERFLTPDQLEAARVCGVTPAMYFMEYIELCKERLFAHVGRELGVRSFPELRAGV